MLNTTDLKYVGAAAVGIVTLLTIRGSSPGSGNIFLVSKAARPALRHVQFPVLRGKVAGP
jgi:hypothetical protein